MIHRLRSAQEHISRREIRPILIQTAEARSKLHSFGAAFRAKPTQSGQVDAIQDGESCGHTALVRGGNLGAHQVSALAIDEDPVLVPGR